MKKAILILIIIFNFIQASMMEIHSELMINSYPKIIGHKMAIRLANVDTHEIRAKCTKEKLLARKAKQFTVRFIRESKSLELRNMRKDKYFRIIADVYNEQKKSLASELINNNLAVPYYGGKKSKDWCK